MLLFTQIYQVVPSYHIHTIYFLRIPATSSNKAFFHQSFQFLSLSNPANFPMGWESQHILQDTKREEDNQVYDDIKKIKQTQSLKLTIITTTA